MISDDTSVWLLRSFPLPSTFYSMFSYKVKQASFLSSLKQLRLSCHHTRTDSLSIILRLPMITLVVFAVCSSTSVRKHFPDKHQWITFDFTPHYTPILFSSSFVFHHFARWIFWTINSVLYYARFDFSSDYCWDRWTYASHLFTSWFM